jgi:hypothetical protein
MLPTTEVNINGVELTTIDTISRWLAELALIAVA